MCAWSGLYACVYVRVVGALVCVCMRECVRCAVCVYVCVCVLERVLEYVCVTVYMCVCARVQVWMYV